MISSQNQGFQFWSKSKYPIQVIDHPDPIRSSRIPKLYTKVAMIVWKSRSDIVSQLIELRTRSANGYQRIVDIDLLLRQGSIN